MIGALAEVVGPGGPVALGALLALFGVVAFGAIVPIVPTGAAVSAAAVLAGRDHWWEIPVVVLVGAAGAYTGDLVTYAALSGAGEPFAERRGWLRPGDDGTRLARLRSRIEEHELRTLLVSRLVPGGRIPVLLVAALTGYPWYRFAGAALAAALLWSLVYASVGVLGGLLPDPRAALLVALLGAGLLSVALHLVRRLSSSRAPEG